MVKITKIFGKGCLPWSSKNHKWNEYFLGTTKNNCDGMLRLKGYVFLFDVYRNIGFIETNESHMYGWKSEDSEKIKMEFHRIDGSDEYEINFVCYPMKNVLPTESELAGN